MATTVNITERFDGTPVHRHAWRDDAGAVKGSVHFGQSWIVFSDPAVARATAAACAQTAEAMEAFPPPEAQVTP